LQPGFDIVRNVTSFGPGSQPASQQRDSFSTERLENEVQGVVISRDADNFTIRDRTRQDYIVRITDDTSIKTYGGFFQGREEVPCHRYPSWIDYRG
jgi:hypothetical protein